MTFTRLSWRLGVPFAAFVLLGTAAVIAWTWWSIESEERSAFEKLAQTNAQFIRQMRLPPTERMALQLSEVLGVNVSFRSREGFIPSLNDLLAIATKNDFERLPADGRFHTTGGWESVAVPLENGTDLVVTKPLVILPHALRHPRTLAVLAAFWILSIAFVWLLTRGLVLPLRNLARKIPDIENPGALELPEAARQDEVGDVARSFLRTREALQRERDQREGAEKLAVLGRMTAALAHEIQNPVAAIKMHAQLAGDSVIENEAARIEGLVNQWMFLSRPEAPAMSDVDVAEIVTACLASCRLQLEHALVRMEANTASGLLVRADKRRLAQVFTNLVVNAIQAMPGGGVLAVDARHSDKRIEVIFSDTGRGFSEQAMNRFAEFFFSEKEGGMGIGLSVADQIIKAHGGELNVANRVEGGGRVTVRLPVCVL